MKEANRQLLTIVQIETRSALGFWRSGVDGTAECY